MPAGEKGVIASATNSVTTVALTDEVGMGVDDALLVESTIGAAVATYSVSYKEQ